MFSVIKREENDCLMKVRVMQLNVSVAIPVSSSNDQQDHCSLSIWDALIQKMCNRCTRAKKSHLCF